MSAILRTGRYSIKEAERNRSHVKPGDTIYMRIYGRSYLGYFTAGPWQPVEGTDQPVGKRWGYFPMDDTRCWSRPVPQVLVIRDLSNQNTRARIVTATRADGIQIETAQRVYERLGFGGADGQIVVLEKGLEEAIKPNLASLQLKLADKDIQQQFWMGPGVGRSDLICTDARDDLVVIEMKRGLTSDQAIGQVLRYVGWVRENIAQDGQGVHGCIVAGDYDEHLRLAASAAGVKLLLVRLG